MAKSNKPILWGPFAAGGTVTAFLTPVLILLTLLVSLGHIPDMLSYENLHAFAGGWVAKLAVLVIVAFSLWGSAHRLRITFFDFGVRADALVAAAVYIAAGVGTVMVLISLLRI